MTPRARKRLLKVAAPVVGLLLGASCAVLPESFHAACHLLAKVVALFGGAF